MTASSPSTPDPPKRAARLLGFGFIAAVWLVALFLAVTLRSRLDPNAEIERDESAFRLYLLGGSTAEGVPYEPPPGRTEPRCDFGVVASLACHGTLAGRPLQVINLARSGQDSQYVWERAQEIISGESDPRWSAVLIYCGNNEYLKHSPADVNRMVETRSLCDPPLLSPAEHEQVLRAYENNLRRTSDHLRDAGISVILSTVSVNLGGSHPNRSVLQDPSNAEFVAQRLEQAEHAVRDGRIADAELEMEQLLSREPRFAWAWKRRGDLFRQQGEFDGALDAYRRGLDHDGEPINVQQSQNTWIRKFTAERDIPLLDAEARMMEAAAQGIPGDELFWDNCHPRLEGQLVIGLELARQLGELTDDRRPLRALSIRILEEELGLDRDFLAAVSHQRGRYLALLSTLTWNPESRWQLSQSYLDAALEWRPHDPDFLCSRAILELCRGDFRASKVFWARAYEQDPDIARERLAEGRLGDYLELHGVKRKALLGLAPLPD